MVDEIRLPNQTPNSTFIQGFSSNMNSHNAQSSRSNTQPIYMEMLDAYHRNNQNHTDQSNNEDQTQHGGNSQLPSYISPTNANISLNSGFNRPQNGTQHPTSNQQPTQANGVRTFSHPVGVTHMRPVGTVISPPPLAPAPVRTPQLRGNKNLTNDEMVDRIRAIIFDRRTVLNSLNSILKSIKKPLKGRKLEKQELIMRQAEVYKSEGQILKLQSLLISCEQVSKDPTTKVSTYTQEVNQLGGSPFGSSSYPAMAHNASMSVYAAPTEAVRQRLPYPQQTSRDTNPRGNGQNELKKPKTLDFWWSPFYELKDVVHTPEFMIPPYSNKIVHKKFTFKFPTEVRENNNLTVVLLSQVYLKSEKAAQPIYFPFFCDIELDGTSIKVNTRGVRGNIGSAKPVDLKKAMLEQLKAGKAGSEKIDAAFKRQHALKISVNILDQGEITSNKAFGFLLKVANFVEIDSLLDQIKKRPHISTQLTKNMVCSLLQDDDVVSDDAVYSLKDSVMMTRIQVPIRSKDCKHIECFDAYSFLMLQSQAETWKCPVCNKRMKWGSLAVDDFFSEILKLAGPTISSVTIKPDGTWSICAESDDDHTSSDDDLPAAKRHREEIVEILSDDDEDVTPAPAPAPASNITIPTSRLVATGLPGNVAGQPALLNRPPLNPQTAPHSNISRPPPRGNFGRRVNEQIVNGRQQQQQPGNIQTEEPISPESQILRDQAILRRGLRSIIDSSDDSAEDEGIVIDLTSD